MSLSPQATADYIELLRQKGLPVTDEAEIEAEGDLKRFALFCRSILKSDWVSYQESKLSGEEDEV